MADAPDLAVQQDTASGPGNDLPQGAASQVNAALPSQTVSEGQTIEAPAPGDQAAAADTSEPELAQDSDYEPVYTPETDDEQFIVGPTTRPDESVSTGAFVRGPRTLSPRLSAAMPMFVAAAELPDAPPQLRLLMQILASDAEQ